MTVREILLLGNPVLYEKSDSLKKSDLQAIRAVVQDLHHTIEDFRKRHGVGRAIAAPQIGEKKRLIFWC